jgi:L-amino acid N-acyltransferase YncA
MSSQPVWDDTTVAAMGPDDWPEVRAIYAEGIAGGNATFETEVPSWEEWDAAHLREHRLVARRGGEIVGWAAVVPVSGRCVYAGVAEHSVYVASAARGQGIGRQLLEALVASTEQGGIWTLQSGIFPENSVSLRLHEVCGFRIVGTRERIGLHQGRWRDVVLMERRTPAATPLPDVEIRSA